MLYRILLISNFLRNFLQRSPILTARSFCFCIAQIAWIFVWKMMAPPLFRSNTWSFSTSDMCPDFLWYAGRMIEEMNHKIKQQLSNLSKPGTFIFKSLKKTALNSMFNQVTLFQSILQTSQSIITWEGMSVSMYIFNIIYIYGRLDASEIGPFNTTLSHTSKDYNINMELTLQLRSLAKYQFPLCLVHVLLCFLVRQSCSSDFDLRMQTALRSTTTTRIQ